MQKLNRTLLKKITILSFLYFNSYIKANKFYPKLMQNLFYIKKSIK
uniref:Uncharacterized protein n=1 Tax=uncultured Desulfobacterium sp. TaxID=201089 RepID=E1YI57_9BACT|nr:unknown protein [uncultured Desulfobacterium sp.]